MNSRNKGKRGEREAAEAVSAALGVSARRGVQYAGGAESPDIVTAVQGVHFEVKRTERLKLQAAVAQAVADAQGKVPVVLHRRNRGEWLAIVPLADLVRLASLIVGIQGAIAPDHQ